MQKSIEELCLKKFNSLPKKCKPNENEGVILAGLAEENLLDGTLRLICLTSGVKCLPFTKISKSGDLLHDMHAEVIARRCLMLYFINELTKLNKGNNSIFERPRDCGKITLRNGLRYHMYISQAPCGDASIVQLSQEIQGVVPETAIPHENTAVKGRLFFDEINRVRTKPGRIDSIPTKSMSCSDKICKWQALGLQGGLLANLIEPVMLTSLTVGKFYDPKELERSLNGRYDETVKLQFCQGHGNLFWSKLDSTNYSSISFNWILGLGEVEVCVDGQKQGSRKRKYNEPSLPLNLQSRLSKARLFNALYPGVPFSFETYLNKKKGCPEFNEKRKKFLSSGNFIGWKFSYDK